MPKPRFKAPPGSDFMVGSDEERTVPKFAIWAPGARFLVDPYGDRAGGFPFFSRDVTEEKFWAAVSDWERSQEVK